MSDSKDICPKCSAPLGDITETQTGKKLRRCSTGSWNSETRQAQGCDYVLWIQAEAKQLDEKCPKCGSNLVLQETRFGKKMKKCSAGSWDKEAKKAIGCDFVEWINGNTEALDIDCPECGKKLVLFTTSTGKKMEKCSTAGWDSKERVATGCTYVRWLKPGEVPVSSAGEEFLPQEPA
ncbi:MAG: topoisomerase DNA-binding C4 zinc finger domain-containing protein [Candidatus Daviesbacteria bacterium]|nr:topoisomerase DNA-binding C4 zinc finger domain-containing protein [Candidatus Daviesbacteria bacterium]